MDRKRNIIATVASLVAAVLTFFLASCESRSDVEVANEERIFLYGNSAEPQGIDPHLVSGVTESKIIAALFEGLCDDHPSDDTIIEPGVAESWERNEDASVWTFRIRKGQTWSDGVPLVAGDFVFSYERMLLPEMAAKYAEMLYFIKNAEAFNKGELKDFSKVGVQALDDHTLQITCKESVPYLPSVTKHYTWFPVPPHAILENGNGETREEKMTDRGSRWTTVEKFVGNGAFVLAEWKFNSYILATKSETYWDSENVWLNGIKFIPAANPYTEYRSFINGQLHTTASLPVELIDRVKFDAPNSLRQEPYVGSMFMRINNTRDVFKDPKVREALNLAIDREKIADNLLLGYTTATSLVPPLGDYNPPDILSFDPERARELLREAGYKDGDALGPIKLLATSKESSRTLCEAMQAMWKENLGLNIQVSNQEWTSYLVSMQDMDFDIALGGWVGDYLDPTTFLTMWIKDGGNNSTGWSSEAFEAKLAAAGQEPDADKRLAILQEAENIFMNDYPVIPVAWHARNYLLHPSVEGWSALALDNHPYKAIKLNSKEAEAKP